MIENVRDGNTMPELATLLDGFAAPSISALAASVADYIHQRPLPYLAEALDPFVLERLASEFHRKAGSFTVEVQKNLERISNGAPRIRIAHQANLFPSLGVVSQFFLLDALATELSTNFDIAPALIYVIIDYDAAADQRFRICHLPDLGCRDGLSSISSEVPKALFQAPMWAVEKPSTNMVKGWIRKLQITMHAELRALRDRGVGELVSGRIERNLREIEETIWFSHGRAQSLVEFNAYFMSLLVNVHWKMPICFVPGQALQPSMRTAYEYLLQCWPAVVQAGHAGAEFFQQRGINIAYPTSQRDPLPIWITCTHENNGIVCNQRVSLYARFDGLLVAYGVCESCESKYEFSLGTTAQPQVDAVLSHGISPRVVADNLLDPLAIGIAGGSLYISAAEHMLLTNYIAARLGWTMPPQCLWRPRSIHYGPSEAHASIIMADKLSSTGLRNRANSALDWSFLGKASILYFLASMGIQEVHTAWDDFFQKRRELSEVNDCTSFSPLDLPRNRWTLS